MQTGMGTDSWSRLLERAAQAQRASVRQASAGRGKNPPSDPGGNLIRIVLSKK